MGNKSLVVAAYPRFIDNAPLVVASLLVVDSLHFIFARLLLPYLPPATSVLYVLAIATVEVAIVVGLRDRIRLDVLRRHLWFFLSVGLLVAASTSINYTAVAFIDPGTAALLGQTSILFGLGFGLFWLRERLQPVEILGAGLALLGIFIITFQPGDYFRLGSLLILSSALMYAGHAALVKRYGQGLRLTDFFLFRLLCTTAFLLLFNLGRGGLMWPPGWAAVLLLLLAGTVDVAVSRGLYYLALRRLKLSLHTIMLTLSPVVTIGWSLLLFDLTPTPQQLLGGAAVMAGVLLVTLGRVQMRNKQVKIKN